MNGEQAGGIKIKLAFIDKGAVEAVKKSGTPPAPPPAGDNKLTLMGAKGLYSAYISIRLNCYED